MLFHMAFNKADNQAIQLHVYLLSKYFTFQFVQGINPVALCLL